MNAPVVSVVIPTFQRAELLSACLDALAGQDAPADTFEVVVVDDGSTDATADVAGRAASRRDNVDVLRQPANRGPAAARNRGIDAARGELILFLDDDVVAPPGLVGQHARFHQEADDRRVGLLGRVAWEPGLRVTSFMRWLDTSGLQFGFDTFLREGPVEPPYAAFYTANVSVPRWLLTEAGGFDERFPHAAYEDMELAYRMAGLGFRLEYRPNVLAYHSRPIDLASFCARMGRVARSAEVLQQVQPGFPVDHGWPEAGRASRSKRAVLRVLAPVAGLTGWERVLRRHYAAEVAAAYASARAGERSRP